MTNISVKFINWYSNNKRDLPWRNTKNPYHIWVSEIILQQTRVDQGYNYYLRFIENFPTIKHLAQADIDSVLKLWQGLGYYSRARNMHFTAKYIYNDLNGKFPNTYEELKKLKGIGEYTAAAIASFAFNETIPAVDGNVYRVLSRLFGIFESTQNSKGKKIFFEKAQTIINKKQPADFNQAIMEFGALQCTPKKPDCEICIFKQSCYAYLNNMIQDLPTKKATVKKRDRYFYYIHINHDQHIYLQKRINKDIWSLLYQLPLIEYDSEQNIEAVFQHPDWISLFKNQTLKIISTSKKLKHILSHQNIYAHFIQVDIKESNKHLDTNYIKVKISNLKKYSTPRLIESYLNENLD